MSCENNKPDACQGCGDAESVIYEMTLSLTAIGWSATFRKIWLCAICIHGLSYEEKFINAER